MLIQQWGDENEAKRRCQEQPSSSKGRRSEEETRRLEESVCAECQIFYGCKEAAQTKGRAICFRCHQDDYENSEKAAWEEGPSWRKEARLGEKIREVKVISINTKGMQIVTSEEKDETEQKILMARIMEQRSIEEKIRKEFQE